MLILTLRSSSIIALNCLISEIYENIFKLYWNAYRSWCDVNHIVKVSIEKKNFDNKCGGKSWKFQKHDFIVKLARPVGQLLWPIPSSNINIFE